MTLRDDLHDWLGAQPEWQQDLAKRLSKRSQLEDDEYNEALNMVRAAFGALAESEAAAEPQAIELADLPTGPSAAHAPRLVSFGRLRGVGQVASDQELNFGPDGLTIIYGPNAAGKTTYVRGLKCVCRTVDCDARVHGDVFAEPAPGAPIRTAKVEIRTPGQELRTQQLDLADPPDLGLDTISVFDAKCAELYVDAENAVAYVPSALLLLARLATAQDRMRRDLGTQADRLAAGQPSFAEFEVPTLIKGRLDSLSATSDLDELRRFATLNDTQRERLAELRAVFAAAETRNTRVDAQAAQQDGVEAQLLATQLRALGARVAASAVDALRTRAAQARDARDAVDLAAREFGDLPVSGVGSEAWERLWHAAREFCEQHATPFPPATDGHCPLCLQKIGADVATRMDHFETHVRSSVQEQARRARQALDSALEAVAEQHVVACRGAFLIGLRAREAELYTSVDSYLNAVARQMDMLRADPLGTGTLPALDSPSELLEEWGRGRTSHAETLLATDNPERERELRSELAELDAREKLLGRLTDVTDWVGVLGRIAALRRAHTALATNRITSKQRELSGAVVTQTLSSKLTEELCNLRCDHLRVDLQPHTAVGETRALLRLAGAHDAPRVSEVLSEGEQRAIDQHATCLCAEHNNQKSDRFPVDFYGEQQLKELSRICGLSLKELKAKALNAGELQRIVADPATFAREWDSRLFAATARKIAELMPTVDLFALLEQASPGTYQLILERLADRPEAVGP